MPQEGIIAASTFRFESFTEQKTHRHQILAQIPDQRFSSI